MAALARSSSSVKDVVNSPCLSLNYNIKQWNEKGRDPQGFRKLQPNTSHGVHIRVGGG